MNETRKGGLESYKAVVVRRSKLCKERFELGYDIFLKVL